MPMLFFAFVIAMMVVETTTDAMRSSHVEAQSFEAAALGANMLVVRNAMQAYLEANPTSSGEIPLADLGLPAWLRVQSDVRAIVQDGRAYIYYTPIHPKVALLSMLGSMPPGLVGTARNAQLVSPRLQSAIPLPPAIPDHSIVLML